MICFIADSNAFAEKAPLGDAGKNLHDLGVNACAATLLYASMHAPTVISNLPSMIAMILVLVSTFNRKILSSSSHPPVLVPPIKWK